MSITLTGKQQFWSEHLAKADQFDGSLAEYARSQNLSAQALYAQRNSVKRRLAKTVSVTKKPIKKKVFTEVISGADRATPGTTLTLGRAQFRFTSLPDPQWLAHLITASQST